jgi:hypothetical protein
LAKTAPRRRNGRQVVLRARKMLRINVIHFCCLGLFPGDRHVSRRDLIVCFDSGSLPTRQWGRPSQPPALYFRRSRRGSYDSFAIWPRRRTPRQCLSPTRRHVRWAKANAIRNRPGSLPRTTYIWIERYGSTGKHRFAAPRPTVEEPRNDILLTNLACSIPFERDLRAFDAGTKSRRKVDHLTISGSLGAFETSSKPPRPTTSTTPWILGQSELNASTTPELARKPVRRPANPFARG